MRGKSLMIQGTASSVGKSVLCAALLRIMKQDGLRAAHIHARKGMDAGAQPPVSMAQLREREFDRIASIVRASVDMDAIYRILRGEA